MEVPMDEKTVARFLAKVDKRGPGECWPWKAGIKSEGYGGFRVGEVVDRAHRVSYVIHHGDIPAGMVVCHRCDNPPCVNPGHLFLGTHGDNARDRDAKGRRGTIGAKHGMAKLTDDDVISIRSSSERGVDLAVQYGVSATLVCDIRKRKIWHHLA
jgi:hypothetical protein